MNAMRQPVLVLNASYEPVNICGAQRALVMLVKGTVVVEEARDVRAHRDYPVPSVVRLKQYHWIPQRSAVQLSHKNIYLRDSYTCQYCGDGFPARLLTLDHVLPRAQGGTSCWENLVAACGPCNRRKDDKTPEQAGMTLLRRPRAMTIHTARSMMRLAGHTEESWQKYLYF